MLLAHVGQALGLMRIINMCRLLQTCGSMAATLQRLWGLQHCCQTLHAFQNRDVRPVWLHKSWQALWNWNDHMQGHGIDPHVDYAETYSSLDPIVSLSFGRGGCVDVGSQKGWTTDQDVVSGRW